jgi:hypothetical protein
LREVLARSRLRTREEAHVPAVYQTTINSLLMMKQLLATERARVGMTEELKSPDGVRGIVSWQETIK